ncbi:hypothetical protein AADG42_08945 [Ammonicoccus fulvus]|uniref:Uncharacterized protein n=1 Tax=Ammonicoccus fulvus TaxID=3138240 RepID=A0ABZ3FRN8_9ACTN
MTTPEDRLRAALRDDSPAPLDAGALIAGARRKQAVNRARFAAAGAAVVLALAGGWRIMAPVANESAPSSAARGGETYAATQAPPPAPSDAAREPAPAESGAAEAERAQVIPGRVVVVHPDRWCVADEADPREADCTARSELHQRVRDGAGAEWLVVLAASGPTTALLEVRQPSGWFSLATTPVQGHDDLWAGSIPAVEVPEAPTGVRAFDASSTQIWHS